MKVKINTEGEVELDVSNGEAHNAIEFIKELQQSKKEEIQKREIVVQERIESTTELSAIQFDLWNYILDHDSEIGTHISALARHFDTTDGAMSHRVMILTNRGFLTRVSRGRYRAKTPE